MNELKTLKDILLHDQGREDLREVAIKHIKHQEEVQALAIQSKDDHSVLTCGVIIEWIKEFFNITEEDLEDLK